MNKANGCMALNSMTVGRSAECALAAKEKKSN